MAEYRPSRRAENRPAGMEEYRPAAPEVPAANLASRVSAAPILNRSPAEQQLESEYGFRFIGEKQYHYGTNA